MSHEIPVFLTGTIHPNDAPPFCREGADFYIQTEPIPFQLRLRPRDGACGRQLAQAAASGERVVVRGVSRRDERPGCDHIEVHGVHPVTSFGDRSSTAAGHGCCPRGQDGTGLPAAPA
jgi:hypothetical protein